MAKKTDKNKLDDFDFDFGENDFNFDVSAPPKPKKGREVITDLASETLKTTASNITDPSFILNVARRSLPSEYNVGFNAVDSTVSDVRDLYNSATSQVRPLVNQMKRVGKKVSPQVSTALPKKLADKFKEWSESADTGTSSAPSKEQIRATNINQEIADFMVTQIQQDASTRNEEKTEKVVDSAVQQIRHKDTLTVLTDMSKSLSKVTAYNEVVTNKFYQKMISVNYQQLYLLADTLEETKITNVKTTEALAAITKNTALPEFVKLQNSERFKEITRNKFFGVVNDNLFQSRDKFVSNFVTNVKKKVGNKISETIGGLRNIISEVESGLEQLQGAGEMMESVGEDKSSVYTLAGGTFAGGIISDKIRKKTTKYLKDKLKDNPNVLRKGNDIAFASKNMKHVIKEKLESNSLDWIPGIDLIRESASQNNGLDTRMVVNKLDDIGKPAIITGLFTSTVNQVIPGLLSRILREVRILRTGDVNQDLIEYDFLNDRFNETKKIKEAVKGKLLKASDSKDLASEGERILAIVDPDNKFTPEQKKEFLNFIMQSKLKDKFINKEYLSSEESYRGKNREMFSKHFKEFFDNDKSGRELNKLDDEVRRYGRYITDNRNTVQLLLNAGYREHVNDTGLMIGSDKDQISMNEYYNKLLNPEQTDSLGYVDTDNRLAHFGNQKIINNNIKNRKRNKKINNVNNPPTNALSIFSDILTEITNISNTVTSLYTLQNDNKNNKSKSGKDECPCEDKFDKVIDSINEIATILKESNKNDDRVVNIDENISIIRDIAYGIMLSEKQDGVTQSPTSWWNKSIGSNIGSLFGAGKKGINKAIDLSKAARAKVTGAVSGVFGAGKKIFNKVFDTVEDVRMKGFDSPVLLAWKIKAGHYIDEKTGKVITNIKDITGDVRDIIDNEIVVRKEDIKKLFYVNSTTKKIVSLKNFVVDKVSALYSANMKMARSMISTVKDFTIGTAKKLYGAFLDAPCDVYVHPKDAPETLRRVLVKQSMRNGAYTSARTKKPITKPSQIDSAVLDYAGKELLSEEDIQNGLFDENGKPIKTGFTKLLQYGKKAAGFIGSKVAGIYQVGKGIFDRTVSGAGKILGGAKDVMFGKDGFIQINGKKTVNVLERIYKLLDDRLPAKKKKILGDSNNDGIRDNSYEDMKAKADDKKKLIDTEKIKDAATVGKDKLGNLAGAGIAGLGGLLSKFKKDKKNGEEDKEKDSSSGWKDTALGAAGITALAWGKNKISGMFAKKATQEIAKAGVQQAAKSGAMRIGGQILARGALLGLQGLFTAGGLLASAGGFVASLFSLPVLLGAAAIAVVGYGAYKGYKYLTKTKLTPLNKVRYAQYGFTENDEKNVEVVFNLEKTLEKHVTWSDNRPSLDLKKVNIKELISSFNVDTSSDKAMNYWISWFNRRFKHVLLNSITARVNTKIECALTEMDKLQAETKLEYLKIAAFPDGPYSETVNPFGGPELTATREVVDAYVKDAEAIIRKDMKDPTKPINVATTNEYSKNYAESINNPTSKPKTKQEIEAKNIANMNVQDVINRDLEKYKVETVAAVVNKEESAIVSSRLHPTTAIRLKAYGLKDLDIEKVKNLLRLEGNVFENIIISSGKVIWKGSVEETLNSNYSLFGLSGSHNKDADNWRVWFRNRFLPVMLAFCTGLVESVPNSLNFSVYKSLDKLNFLVDSLNTEQALSVASRMYSAKSNDGSPIWGVTNSPWGDYVINNDIKSIDGNLEAIRKLQTTKVIPETTTKSSVEKESKNTKPTNTTSENTNTIKKPESTGFFSDVKKTLSDWGDKVTTNAKATASAVGDAASSAYTATKEALGYIDNPGHGTGGDVNSLPDVKPGKGYAAYKDLLDAAAKMSGVDPKLLAIMTAIESNFNPKASPGTSAAQGLQQFIPSTWKAMLQKYGIKKYGINPKAPPTDVKASSLMAGEYIKENYTYLSKQLGRQLSPAEIYAAHMLGAGGANTLYKMKDDEIPALKMTAAAKANKNVFYRGGDVSKPRTAAELKSWYTSRVVSAAKQYGIDANYSSTVATQNPAATSGSSATSSTPGNAISGGVPNQSVNTDKRAISGTPGIPQTSAVPVDTSSTKTALPGKNEVSNTPTDTNTTTKTPTPLASNPYGNLVDNKSTSPTIKPVDDTANKIRSNQVDELKEGNRLVTQQNKILTDTYILLQNIGNNLKPSQPTQNNSQPPVDNNSNTNQRQRVITTPKDLPPPLINVNTKFQS